MTLDALIDRLASARGIGEAYQDHRGELRHFSRETRESILEAMGCDTSSEAAVQGELDRLESTRWTSLLPQVAIVASAPRAVELRVAADALEAMVRWRLTLDDGSEHDGASCARDLAETERWDVQGAAWTRRRLPIGDSTPIGRHVLRVQLEGQGEEAECALVVAPPRCFEPDALRAGERLWGLAVQLYTLRSRENWGIGDFADLEHVVRRSALHGASYVGLNPLHALIPSKPEHVSPYSPSSRHFLNVLYIAVPLIPEFDDCVEAREHTESDDFQAEIQRLRTTALVDYVGVTRAKLDVLRKIYRHFVRQHLPRRTARAEAFRRYRDERGDRLRLHALHDAIAEDLRSRDAATYWGWPTWPQPLRDPSGPGVAEFAREHVDAVQFHAWLQWVADEQLGAVQKLAVELGMPIGLFGDYAVGVDPSGSETWAEQHLFCGSAAVGAPPDALALKGQDWGTPPQDPVVLVALRHEPFQALIGANVRHFGALRLDHVMSLLRQWWVPRGRGATEGGYVHYPLDDLMSLLALESVRNRCLIVGEDLGTVPDEVRRAMAEYGAYHYKVLLFEKEERTGGFRQPRHFERRAIATVTTHDLPTLRGWWEGCDLALRDRLDLYPDEETRRVVHEQRALDRARMLEALKGAGLWPSRTLLRGSDDDRDRHGADPGPGPFSEDLARAVHLYLARSAAALVVLQAEDLLGMTEPVNVPGTYEEYPNWQRKTSALIEDLFDDEATAEFLEDVQFARSEQAVKPVAR